MPGALEREREPPLPGTDIAGVDQELAQRLGIGSETLLLALRALAVDQRDPTSAFEAPIAVAVIGGQHLGPGFVEPADAGSRRDIGGADAVRGAVLAVEAELPRLPPGPFEERPKAG